MLWIHLDTAYRKADPGAVQPCMGPAGPPRMFVTEKGHLHNLEVPHQSAVRIKPQVPTLSRCFHAF